MAFEKITGKVSLQAVGENAFVKRSNGVKIKIPSTEILNNLQRELSNLKGKEIELRSAEYREKFKEFEKKVPKIEEGDILMTGRDSIIFVNSTHDKGKDNPTNVSESKSIYITGNGAEVKVTGIEKWEKEDKKDGAKYLGSCVGDFEILQEGYYICDYSNNEKILKTPLADIKFKKAGGRIIIDFYKGILYMVSYPNMSSKEKDAGIEFVLKNSGKSYIDQKEASKEIDISPSGLYKKSLLNSDMISESTFIQTTISSFFFDPTIAMGKEPENTKDIMKNIKEGQVAIETIKGLSSSDISELGKGTGMDKSQIQQLMNTAEMLKTMKNEIPFDKIYEGLEKLNAFQEGLNEGDKDNRAKVHKILKEKVSQDLNKNKSEFFIKINSPRVHAPLTSEFKIL